MDGMCKVRLLRTDKASHTSVKYEVLLGVPCGGSRSRQEGGGGGEQEQDQTKPPGQFPPDTSGNLTQVAGLS